MAIENNFLSPIGFALKIDRTPNVDYAVQQVSVPGLNIGSIQTPTPFARITHPGNISYDELRVTFKVGENLGSYFEIFNWMVALGHPDNFSQYRDIKSDGSLVILNSAKRPNIVAKFTNMYPTTLTSLEFDATMTDVQYATADVTFAFDRIFYEIL